MLGKLYFCIDSAVLFSDMGTPQDIHTSNQVCHLSCGIPVRGVGSWTNEMRHTNTTYDIQQQMNCTEIQNGGWEHSSTMRRVRVEKRH